MSEHKPCPWCRTAEYLEVTITKVSCWVLCNKCGSSGPSAYSVEKAWSAWDEISKGEWLDRPTEPGWWWCRRNCFREVVYIELFNMKQGTFKRMDGDTCHFGGYLWQGPIHPQD